MLNKVVLMGRLTRDPEVRTTPSGVMLARFSLAVESDIKGQNGERQTDFFDITIWRKLAEFAQTYLTKGRMVVVAGRLKTDTWEDNSGKRQQKVSVVGENVYFADSKKESAPSNVPTPTSPGTPSYGFNRQAPPQMRIDDDDFTELDIQDEDLPF